MGAITLARRKQKSFMSVAWLGQSIITSPQQIIPHTLLQSLSVENALSQQRKIFQQAASVISVAKRPLPQ